MSDRWSIEIKDLNQDETRLVAEPKVEFLAKYVNDAIQMLQHQIANKEEEMIFRGSSSMSLERIRDCCIKLLNERDELKTHT